MYGNSCRVLGLTLNLARFDIIADVLWTPSIDLATCAESSSQNLQDSSLEVLGHGLEPHLASNLDDLIQRDGLGVLDVLLLLAVTRGLLQRLDDERGCGGNDGDSGLTILNGKLDSHAQTFLYFHSH
jgi:hypothetical protein